EGSRVSLSLMAAGGMGAASPGGRYAGPLNPRARSPDGRTKKGDPGEIIRPAAGPTDDAGEILAPGWNCSRPAAAAGRRGLRAGYNSGQRRGRRCRSTTGPGLTTGRSTTST